MAPELDADERILLGGLDLTKSITVAALIEYYDWQNHARPSPDAMRAMLERLIARGLVRRAGDDAFLRAPTIGDELEAAIYAQPDDDARRAVYADWLCEAEQPRGELIALQLKAARGPLTRAEQRREKALVTKGFREWLGPLGALLSKRGSRFARGFLAEAEIAAPYTKLAPHLADWRWATVEVLRAPSLELLALLMRAPLPQLRRADGVVSDQSLPSLIGHAVDFPRLAELTVQVPHADFSGREARKTFALIAQLVAQLPAFACLGLRVWNLALASEALIGRPAPAPNVVLTQDRDGGQRRLVRDRDGKLAPVSLP